MKTGQFFAPAESNAACSAAQLSRFEDFTPNRVRSNMPSGVPAVPATAIMANEPPDNIARRLAFHISGYLSTQGAEQSRTPANEPAAKEHGTRRWRVRAIAGRDRYPFQALHPALRGGE